MAGLFLARRMAKQTTKPMNTKNNTGQAMRDARRRLDLTQQQLAQRVGCTESLVTKIETGRATPEQSIKEAIARELNIATWEVGV